MPQTPYKDGAYTPPLQTPLQAPSSKSTITFTLSFVTYELAWTWTRRNAVTAWTSHSPVFGNKIFSTLTLSDDTSTSTSTIASGVRRIVFITNANPSTRFCARVLQAQIDSAHEQAATAARETLIQNFPSG